MGKYVEYKFMQKINRVFYLNDVTPCGFKTRKALFMCYCGKLFRASISKVKIEHTKSCGCYRFKHGFSNTRIHVIWGDMKQRCNNKNFKHYKNYGARGITYCKKWETFEGFYEDMGSFYNKNLTIDRIDNNKGYFKENCRWVTRKIQAWNRRKRKNSTSKYIGVSFCKDRINQRKKWVASIGINNKHKYLGRFKSEEEAAITYNKKAMELRGENARLNEVAL